MTDWQATFTLELSPAQPLLDGTNRFDFSKTWSGDIEGTGRGVMLSAGDPGTGTAGYVAIETFEGRIGGGTGSCAFQQFGTMVDGHQVLHYEIVPGSGSGGLAGLAGPLQLTIDEDGTHRVTLPT